MSISTRNGTQSELYDLANLIADRVVAQLNDRPRLLDRHSLAEQLGVSVPSVDRLRAAGRIQPIMVGARVMYDVEAVIADLAGGDDDA